MCIYPIHTACIISLLLQINIPNHVVKGRSTYYLHDPRLEPATYIRCTSISIARRLTSGRK